MSPFYKTGFKKLTVTEAAPSREYNFIKIISQNHIVMIQTEIVAQYINRVDFKNLFSGNFLKGKA